MRIDGPGRSAAASSAPRPRRAEGGAFALDAGQGARAAGTAGGVAATGGLDALIALQMVGDPLTGRRRGVARGRQMLAALDDLKLALLAGEVPAGGLARLLATVEGRERDSADERLEGILDEIELRARVELAKLGRAPRL
jgi:hypothetical protein